MLSENSTEPFLAPSSEQQCKILFVCGGGMNPGLKLKKEGLLEFRGPLHIN